MALNVPPINTRGLYSLRAPFATEPNQLYVCAAIRQFKDIENQGIDVYKRYYEPFDIAQNIYQADKQQGAVIVTLTTDNFPPIYVPSTYINSFPGIADIDYSHVVLSISLGALPDSLDLTFLKNQLAALTSDIIGVTPTVKENVAVINGAVTPEQHDTLTAAREAAISNRTTDRARLLAVQAENQQLAQRLQILEQIIIDNDLLP